VVGLPRAFDARLASLAEAETGPAEALGVEATREVVRAVAAAVAILVEAQAPPVLLCSPAARPVLKDLSRADLPRLVVLSQREVPRDVPVEVVATLGEADERLVQPSPPQQQQQTEIRVHPAATAVPPAPNAATTRREGAEPRSANPASSGVEIG
jgi:hypothetical protein